MRIHQESRTSSDHDLDLNNLICINTANSRSDSLTRCMLRNPYSDTDHKRYAQYHCTTALEKASSCYVLIAQVDHDLGYLLGSVWIELHKTADPFGTLELPDFINEDVYRYVLFQAEVQRMMKMERDYYCMDSLATA